MHTSLLSYDFDAILKRVAIFTRVDSRTHTYRDECIHIYIQRCLHTYMYKRSHIQTHTYTLTTAHAQAYTAGQCAGPPLWAEVPLKSLEILLRGRLPRGRAMLEGKRWQVAGAQMRFTLPEAYHGPSGAEEEIESILTCALDAQRSSVRSILISCDSHRHRERIIAALRRSLGCVRSAWGDIQPLGIGNGTELLSFPTHAFFYTPAARLFPSSKLQKRSKAL